MRSNKTEKKPTYLNLSNGILILLLWLSPVSHNLAFDFAKSLKTMKDSLKRNVADPVTKSLNKPPDTTSVKQASQTSERSKQYQITYEGYSKEFIPIKEQIIAGNLDQALALEQEFIRAEGANFLNSVESGLIAIDTGHSVDSIDTFFTAERFLKQFLDRSLVEDTATTYGLEALSVVTGKGDITEYTGEPYERILMLNYKSIAYLLNGERKAYNVTRRSIDWQNIEKKEFDKTISEVKEQVESASNKEGEEKSETVSYAPTAMSTIFEIYQRHQAQAESVPNAYINPFGYYMAGIIQEFDSYQDASLRSNARISYQKALDLNPKSQVIKDAVKAVNKKPPRNKRLVHVVAADGFSPEKKTLTLMLALPGGLVPIKTPLFEPVASSVKNIKVKAGRTTLATLSPIADIEAISLRHQLDMLPVENLKVMGSIGRNIGENLLWSQLGPFGIIGKLARESLANPDMRSWMSLPKNISAARFYASKRLKKIKIISYDKKGHILAQQDVTLNKDSHNFIYARSIEKFMYAQVNKKLWMKTK